MHETWRRIPKIIFAAAMLSIAVAVALWSDAQTNEMPGLQTWMYLAIPCVAAVLMIFQRRPMSEVVMVYAEVLFIPSLMAAQIVHVGLTDQFVPLLLGIQVGAVVVGQWARWQR